MKKYFRALKAKELLEVFKEYLQEEKQLVFLEWLQKEPSEWFYLKAKLEILEEIEKIIENEAKNVNFIREEAEELEEAKEKIEKEE